MVAPLNIAGQRFGRLTAVESLGSDKHGKRVWSFACDCGGSINVPASGVKSGKTQSCGCLLAETAAENGRNGANKVSQAKTKHGAAGRIPEYSIWKMMRQRCKNQRNKDFPAYGGRGVEVCARWDDFAAFLADMGSRPTSRHSIDRINPNGDYEPINCRWADDYEQAANRRPRGTGEYANKENQS